MIVKGFAPIHVFQLPVPSILIKNFVVIYTQRDEEILRKERKDCTLENNYVAVNLTQSDTLSLDHRYPVRFQLRGVTTEGVPFGTQIRTETVVESLTNEVIV